MSVAAIGAIGSVGSVGSVSYVSPVNNSFKIDNNSQVSDAYKKSVEKSDGTGRVDPVDPVMYANASMKTQTVDKTEDVLRTDKAFADIARSFGSATTGYNSSAAASNYSMAGAGFDAFV
ncbi:MAG: hypothetical protein K6F00_08010 [Lachnospiraceae bacterium]|nr:hypothetical protein [Lachnospiraceae bacterium]